MVNEAFKFLTKDKILQIEKHFPILYSDLSIIETLGEGSARCCMMMGKFFYLDIFYINYPS